MNRGFNSIFRDSTMGKRTVFATLFLQLAALTLAEKSPLSKLYSNTTASDDLDANIEVPQENGNEAVTKRGLVTSAGVTYLASAVSNAFLSFAHSGATVSGTVINDSPYFLLYDGCNEEHGHLTDVPGSLKPGQSTTFKGYVKFSGVGGSTPLPDQNVWFSCTYKTKALYPSKITFMVFVHLDVVRDKANKLAIEVCKEGTCFGDNIDNMFDDEANHGSHMVKRKYSSTAR